MQFFSLKGKNQGKNEPFFPFSGCFWGRRGVESGSPAVSRGCGDGHCHICGAVPGGGTTHPPSPPHPKICLLEEKERAEPPPKWKISTFRWVRPQPGFGCAGAAATAHRGEVGGGFWGSGWGKIGVQRHKPKPIGFPSRPSFFSLFLPFSHGPNAEGLGDFAVSGAFGFSSSLFSSFFFTPHPSPLFLFFFILECKASG